MRVRDILRSERDVEKIDLLGLLSTVLSLPVETLLTRSERELVRDEEDCFRLLLEQRRRGRPMAYITGIKEFFSRPFVVDDRVLIPRPETETLVEEALRIISSRFGKAVRIVDVGTGSGAVGITLAKETGLPVVCVDISHDALLVAGLNAKRLGVGHLVDLVCSDLLSAFGEEGRFDLLVANLPYISSPEWPTLMPDVRLFEPKRALLGGEDGLDVYRRLLSRVRTHLSDEAHVLCEVGGPEQALALSGLLRAIGLSVYTKKDLADVERVVVGSCRSS